MMTQAFGLGMVAGPDAPQLVVCREERFQSLAALMPRAQVPSTVHEMLGEWDAWIERIGSAVESASGSWQAYDTGRFLPPVGDPPNVYCAGANFYDHINEMKVQAPVKATEPAYHFQVPSTSLVGHGEAVRRPAGVVKLDWEVELVALIGRAAWRVSAADALEYVAGYTVANDISVRDMENVMHGIFGARWLFSKGQATMNPIGPAVVPATFVEDPMRLALSLSVNGVVRQDSNTESMIWSVQEQIEALSSMFLLQPGDLIFTGTPAGTAAAHGVYLADGDEMRASVEGLGVLVNRVVAPTSEPL